MNLPALDNLGVPLVFFGRERRPWTGGGHRMPVVCNPLQLMGEIEYEG